ncbi:MAG: heparinase II/III family protein, partial [Acidobacteriota bacterium]|nr:heparinase II/III family protein [Acidobacteriota bacterium]
QITDGVWAICEETFWGIPAHLGAQKAGTGLPDVNEPIIDLFAAETAAGLAWIDYLIGPQLDTVNKLVRQRIEEEIERRILAVYRAREDFGWMGLRNPNPVNNWNPWINSNVLTCALLIDRDGPRRARTVFKILTSVDRFLDGYHPDGGCDEGPGYWSRAGASLFECLDLMRSASAGSVNYFDLPLVREIGAYIYRVQIAGDWFVNFADAPARVHPDPDLVYRYGKATGDPLMTGFGAWLARSGAPGLEGFGRALPALFGYTELRHAEPRDPLVRESWMPGIQVATAREKAGATDGLYFAAQGGHNAESHNHNDVGNFVVYANGQPVLIDVGVETYTAKTFSSHRYEIWTMQSAYHNLPTINGVMQGAGRQYAARDVSFTSGDDAAAFAAEIAAAYPKDAGVQRWNRSIRLDRGQNQVTVTDRYTLGAPGKLEFSLMTPCTVRQEDGAIVFEGRARLTVTGPSAPVVRVEDIPIEDARLRSSWGNMLRRVLVSWEKAPASGEIVMRIA